MIWALLFFPLFWPFVAKKIWPHEITKDEMLINIAMCMIIVAGTYYAGKYYQIHDTKVIHGEMISKDRRNYRTTGTHKCGKSRCTHTVYISTWDLKTSVGGINVKTARTDYVPIAWALPDPEQYTKAYKGMPVSKEKGFTNYIKGAPNSLFHALSDHDPMKYPAVHSVYEFDGAIGYGTKENSILAETFKMNHLINVVLVQTNEGPAFKERLQNDWLGGKINDIVIVRGPDWTDVFTWAKSKGNEEYVVSLRDRIKNIPDIEMLLQQVKLSLPAFKIPSEEEFQYLEESCEPPTWVLILAWLLSVVGTVGVSVYFANNEEREWKYQ